MDCIIAFILLALAVYLAPIIGAIAMAMERSRDQECRATLQRARLAELEERRETARLIREAKLADAANKVVLSDQKIELQQIKIRAEKEKTGENHPFTPAGYS